jgi:Ca2+-dependent lipid-binding protein
LFRYTPNPYAKVTITGGPQEGTVIGRTETIRRSCNPDWAKSLLVETDSSVFMPIRVEIYDERGFKDDVLLAEANFETTEVFQNPGHMQWEKVRGAK